MTLSNTALKPVKIIKVSTSCGCLEVMSAPDRLGAFDQGEIVLIGRPLRPQWGERQFVQIVLSSGTLTYGLEILPIPMWEGFPDPPCPLTADSGSVTFRLDDAYDGIVTRVDVLPTDATPPIPFTVGDGEFTVDSSLLNTYSATLLFIGQDGEAPLWASSVSVPCANP